MLEQFGLADDAGFEELYSFSLNAYTEKSILETWQDLLLELLIAGQDYFGPDWALSRDLAVLEIGFGPMTIASEALNMKAIGEWPYDYVNRAFAAVEGGLEDYPPFIASMAPDGEEMLYTLFKGLSYLKGIERNFNTRIGNNAREIYLTDMHLSRITLSANAARDSVLKQQITEGVANLRLRLAGIGRQGPAGPRL